MNRLIFLITSYCLWLSFTACQPPTPSSVEGNKRAEFVPQSVSQHYQVPAFEQDQRVRQLSQLEDDLHAFYRAKADAYHIPGMVYGIVVGDSLVVSGSYGVVNQESRAAVDANSLFRIASMTKSFVCMAILKLRDEGKLELRAPVEKYLPELEKLTYLTADAPPVTIGHLMTMNAGFPEDNPWADRQLEDSEEEFTAFLQQGISMSNLPGAAYEYSNLGYAMLGRIISHVSGQPYQNYIQAHILQPLGMSDTHWEYRDLPPSQLAIGYRWEEGEWKLEPMLHDGAFGAIGGLITSLSDFSKYVGFHVSAWPARNDPDNGPVSRSTIREMHQMRNPRLNADALDQQGNPCAVMAAYSYGLGVYEDCSGLRKVSHSGGLPGFGSEYQFYPDLGLGVISFANRTYAPARSLNNEVVQILRARMDLNKRSSPPSALLRQRKEEVLQLVQAWDADFDKDIVAENFYLDQSRPLRKAAAQAIWNEAGRIVSVEEIQPVNQLRGTFLIRCEKQDIEVFFSLSPEKNPKVQAVSMMIVNAS